MSDSAATGCGTAQNNTVQYSTEPPCSLCADHELVGCLQAAAGGHCHFNGHHPIVRPCQLLPVFSISQKAPYLVMITLERLVMITLERFLPVFPYVLPVP